MYRRFRFRMKFFCLLVLLHSFFHARASDEVFADTMRAGLFGGVIASCCYGLYKFGSWLFEKTENQILYATYQLHDLSYARYEDMFALLAKQCIEDDVRAIDEQLLYAIGSAKVKDLYIDDYLAELNATLDRVQSQYRIAHGQLVRLEQAVLKEDYIDMKREFVIVCARLKELEKKLFCLSYLIRYHRSYFILFEFESDLYGRYDRELSIVQQSGLDFYHKQEAIRAIIYAQSVHYGYSAYVDMLEADYKKLIMFIGQTGNRYVYRKEAAQQLKNYLCDIRAVAFS